MSTKAVIEFLSKLEEDGELMDRCRKALESEGPEAVANLAAEKGWEFTVEEFAEHVASGDELDNGALDQVAGGRRGDRRVIANPRIIRGAFTRTFQPKIGWALEDETGSDGEPEYM
jgi:predicted ribosomally synthesized peptide with nif11-like leader